MYSSDEKMKRQGIKKLIGGKASLRAAFFAVLTTHFNRHISGKPINIVSVADRVVPWPVSPL